MEEFWVIIIVALCGIFYVERLRVADFVIDEFVDTNISDLNFVASLAPGICLYDDYEALDISIDNLPANAKALDSLLSKASRIADKIQAYDDQTQAVQSSILNQMALIKSGLQSALHTGTKINNQLAIENYLGAFITGFSGVAKGSDVMDQVDAGNAQIKQDVSAYIEDLDNRLTARNDAIAGVAQLLLTYVYSDIDKVKLANHVVDQFLFRAKQVPLFSAYYQTGCLHEELAQARRNILESIDTVQPGQLYEVACVSNPTNYTVTYSYAWSNGNWQSVRLEPGKQWTHGNGEAGALRIQINESLSGEPTKRTYVLDTKLATKQACGLAVQYRLLANDQRLTVMQVH